MDKRTIKEETKNALLDLMTDNEESSFKKAYSNLSSITNLDDIDSSIENTFFEFDIIKKKKVKNEDIRLLSIISMAVMITGLIMIKNLFTILMFIVGMIISSFYLSKSQKSLSRISIGYRAYQEVLLKLHEMKILHSISK